MSPSSFSKQTCEILDAASIRRFDSVCDIELQTLPDDIEFLISDLDGVLRPYNGAISQQTLNHFARLNTKLSKGSAVVTNNPTATVEELSSTTTFHRFSFPKLWDFKPFPYAIKQAIEVHDADPKKTLAIGDGLSDLLAYKLAGVRHLGLVATTGCHGVQEFVHRYGYGRLAPLGASALRGTQLVRGYINKDDQAA